MVIELVIVYFKVSLFFLSDKMLSGTLALILKTNGKMLCSHLYAGRYDEGDQRLFLLLLQSLAAK